MFSLFDLKEESNLPVRPNQDWLNLSKILRQNLDTVVDYYRKHSLAVDSQHFLVSLMLNVNVPLGLGLDRYYANVVAKSPELCTTMGLASSTQRGRVFKGAFFPKDCLELLVSVEEEFDYEYAFEHWREVRAVECLRVPFSDMGYVLPNTRKGQSDSGLVVLTINLPLLMIQYRAFRENEYRLSKENPEYQQRSIMQFVHMFVLSNMMYSLMDCVLFNRMSNHLLGVPMGEAIRRHAFPIIHANKRLNKVQSRLTKLFCNNNTRSNVVMFNTPLLSKMNVLEWSVLPDIVETRQITPTLVLSRLHVLRWLLTILKENGNTDDIATMNKLRRYFMRTKQNNVWGSHYPPQLFQLIRDELQDVYDLLNIK